MDIVERLRKAQQTFYGDTSINEFHMYAPDEIERLREDKNIYAETIYELEKDVRVKNDQIERLRDALRLERQSRDAALALANDLQNEAQILAANKYEAEGKN